MPLTVLKGRLKLFLELLEGKVLESHVFVFNHVILMLSVGSNRECLKIRRRVSKCLFQDRLIHFNLFAVNNCKGVTLNRRFRIFNKLESGGIFRPTTNPD